MQSRLHCVLSVAVQSRLHCVLLGRGWGNGERRGNLRFEWRGGFPFEFKVLLRQGVFVVFGDDHNVVLSLLSGVNFQASFPVAASIVIPGGGFFQLVSNGVFIRVCRNT